jgi:hypothetical protein
MPTSLYSPNTIMVPTPTGSSSLGMGSQKVNTLQCSLTRMTLSFELAQRSKMGTDPRSLFAYVRNDTRPDSLVIIMISMSLGISTLDWWLIKVLPTLTPLTSLCNRIKGGLGRLGQPTTCVCWIRLESRQMNSRGWSTRSATPSRGVPSRFHLFLSVILQASQLTPATSPKLTNRPGMSESKDYSP